LADVFCFDAQGLLLPTVPGVFTRPDTAAPGATVTFDIFLFGKPCPTFLVGVSARPSGRNHGCDPDWHPDVKKKMAAP